MTGLSREQRLERLAHTLSARDQTIVREVARLKFVSARQLERLCFAEIALPMTRTRRAQRSLARLTQHDLLQRLERRVGGARAGSSGHVYAATGEAHRLIDHWTRGASASPPRRHRRLREPGVGFVDHYLAGSELYVRLVEAGQSGVLELLRHDAEPAAWRSYPTGIGGLGNLRPDAYIAVGSGELEVLSFVELDRGTEGSRTLERKLATYVDYWRSGREQHEHGVFPQVVWLTTTPRRVSAIQTLIDDLEPPARRLFRVGLQDQAIALLSPQAANGAES